MTPDDRGRALQRAIRLQQSPPQRNHRNPVAPMTGGWGEPDQEGTPENGEGISSTRNIAEGVTLEINGDVVTAVMRSPNSANTCGASPINSPPKPTSSPSTSEKPTDQTRSRGQRPPRDPRDSLHEYVSRISGAGH